MIGIIFQKKQHLSETFIRKFKHYLVWDYISAYNKLSEDFISEFKNRVNWHIISQTQTLSEDFISRLWCVDWISSEGDSIKSFEHENIIEVIKQASQWVNENFSDSGE